MEYQSQKVTHASKFKYLRVTLDPHLTFHDDMKYIQGRTIGKLKLLSRVASFLPEKLGFTLYEILIRPHFDYCDVVCDCITEVNSNKRVLNLF